MKVKKNLPKPSAPFLPYRLVASLAFLVLVCIGLLGTRVIFSDSLRYSFLFWNLFLAISPVLIAWWLVVRIREHGWLRWQQILLTSAWVLFLPNSFYIITDLIHLRANYEADLLFDIVLITNFIVAGLLFGFISTYLVHMEIVKRVRERWAYGLIAVLFLAVSFAVYLGRYTRWNTWDIILRPAGLLFDVSDRFINANAHSQTYQATLVLFLLLISSYAVVYELARLLRSYR